MRETERKLNLLREGKEGIGGILGRRRESDEGNGIRSNWPIRALFACRENFYVFVCRLVRVIIGGE